MSIEVDMPAIDRERLNADPYVLRGGEEVRSGILFGWTGDECPDCHGCGEDHDARACVGCGGTGELWGKMHVQPPHLPADTE